MPDAALVTDASRDELSVPAQNEIGSATTLFKITTGREEFERLLAEPGSAEAEYSWVVFYTELGQRFLDCAGDRNAFLQKFWTVADRSGYPHLFKYLKADKLRDGSSGPLRDTDPFTVLASFNRGIKDDARAEIARAFAEEFQVSAPLPTQFSGIPTANNLKSWFVRHEIERGQNDIENLWRLASAAVAYSVQADEFDPRKPGDRVRRGSHRQYTAAHHGPLLDVPKGFCRLRFRECELYREGVPRPRGHA